MKTLFNKNPFTKGLKQLAKENKGENPKILDDVIFKAMLSADNEDSREALRSLLSACTHREVSTVKIINNDLVPNYIEAKTARLDINVTFNDSDQGRNRNLDGRGEMVHVYEESGTPYHRNCGIHRPSVRNH